MTTTRFIHLTDTHIQPSESDRLFGVDTMGNLRVALAYLRGQGLGAELPIVISGDLANNGEPESYLRLRAVVEELRTEGTLVLLALGNHDNRAVFRAAMLDDASPVDDTPAPYYYREMLGDLRLLVLDTSVSGIPTGAMDAAQHAWLVDELATPAPGGTIVVMHHPPTDTPLRDGKTNAALDGPAFADNAALAEAIRGRDVLGILAGHVHLAAMRTLAGVPYLTAPGTAFLIDPFEPDGLRYFTGGGVNVVTVTDGQMDVKPVPIPGPRMEIVHHRASGIGSAH